MNVRKTQETSRVGFTLTEMLVVVAIIVVLAGIGATILLPQLERAKESAAKIQAKNIAEAAKLFYTNHSYLPGSVQELTQPDNVYLNGAAYLPADAVYSPWGNNEVYQISMGAGLEPYVSVSHNNKVFDNVTK